LSTYIISSEYPYKYQFCVRFNNCFIRLATMFGCREIQVVHFNRRFPANTMHNRYNNNGGNNITYGIRASA